jgi:ribosomal 30S subunit maturation factor RimM
MEASAHAFQLIGDEVVDLEGHRIGKVTEISSDPNTLAPEWLVVKTSKFGRLRLLPLDQAVDQGAGVIRVPYRKEVVLDAPAPELPGSLATPEREALLRHYAHVA